jgi:hypothetical protein
MQEIINKIKSLFKDNIVWHNRLIKCPSQSYCYFKSGNNTYCIYLRWRYSDPWTAQIIPIVDNDFNYQADWKDLDIKFYTHDELIELQKECINRVKILYPNIKFINKI